MPITAVSTICVGDVKKSNEVLNKFLNGINYVDGCVFNQNELL